MHDADPTSDLKDKLHTVYMYFLHMVHPATQDALDEQEAHSAVNGRLPNTAYLIHCHYLIHISFMPCC